MKRYFFFVAGVVLFLTVGFSEARATLHGKTIKVIDGDTIDVELKNGAVERIRVYGINAPETYEPCYREAKNLAKKLTLGKDVKILSRGRGHYKRLLGFVVVNNKSLGLELLKAGYARVYSNKFAPENNQTYERYQKAQMHAMTGELGIWGKKCWSKK